ncbi:MAG: hypothetical protein GY953_05950, partial [bacterium]|nr:hypothetical protein [bacterium]
MLGTAAGLLGLPLAYAGARGLVVLVSLGRSPLSLDVSPDLRLLAFAAGLALLSTVLFGLAPAVRAGGSDIRGSLAGTAATIASSRSGLRGHRTLAVLEVALTLVLVTGAGLFLRTINNLENHDSGFARENVLRAVISPRDAGYALPRAKNAPEAERREAEARLTGLYTSLLSRLEALPGVESASFSHTGVLSFRWNGMPSIEVEGYPPAEDEDRTIRYDSVGPRYFETTGTNLVAGRDFTVRDNASAPPVAIINEKMARSYFGSENAIGKHFHFGEPERFEIIGVARDGRYDGPREEIPRFIYFPQLHQPSDMATIVLRTRGRPSVLTSAVRQAIKDTDSRLQTISIATLNEQLARYFHTERVLAQLSTLFSLLALAVTCVGLFGLMAYSVARRTNEIGLRMALGAQRSAIV